MEEFMEANVIDRAELDEILNEYSAETFELHDSIPMEVDFGPSPRPSVSSPRPSVSSPRPLVSSPRPLVSSPGPLVSSPGPLVSSPGPLVSSPGPLVSSPGPLVSSPRPSDSSPRPLVTFNSECSVLSPSPVSHTRAKKKPVPDEEKDDKYWEMRKKNTEATKRSRAMKKAKMDEILTNKISLEKGFAGLKKTHEQLQKKYKCLQTQNKFLAQKVSDIVKLCQANPDWRHEE